MTRRQLIRDLVAGKAVERCGLWIGSPQKETIELLNAATGTQGEEALHLYFDDDVRWITPHYMKSTYQHPAGLGMRYWKDANPHGMSGGILANATTIEEIDAVKWPEVKYLHFDECISALQNAGDYYRLSAFWSPFYHDLTYLFGTEELLLKLMLEPELVHRALEHLCNFYLEANELFYQQTTGLVDGMFFGNDFGTQKDMLFDPMQFEDFFLPWIKKFADQAHRYNVQAVLHSCGSIFRIIDSLIDAGIDAIHPIQALATNMNADYLAANFKGRIAFVGGIDTQEILTTGTPEEVYNETVRVKNILGNNIILGPSHEVLMPNVPFDNVKAMCDAVKGLPFNNK